MEPLIFTCVKPVFIRDMLREHQRPIFCTDEEAKILKPIDFEVFSAYEFSVRINEFLPKTHEFRVVENVIYAKPCENCYHLLDLWIKHGSLNAALNEIEALQFLPMPLKFSKVFAFDSLFISQEDIVIEHPQSSKLFHPFAKDHCCH